MPQPVALPLSAAEFSARQDARNQARAFLRFARCKAQAQPGLVSAADLYRAAYPRTVDLERVIKAAVGGATSGSGSWGEPLIGDPIYAGAFLAMLRPLTVLGRLQGLRRVGLRRWAARQTGAAAAGWVGPGQALKVARAAFDRVQLDAGTLGAIYVATEELVEASSPDAEALFEQDLIAACVEAADRTLLDPAEAGVPEVSPPSITASAGFTVAASGNDAAAVRADATALVQRMADAGITFTAPYFITSTSAAAGLAGLATLAGDAAFPGVSVKGGDLLGIPLLTSNACPPVLVLVDAAMLLLADEGADVTTSKVAALEMADAPISDVGPPTGATGTVSMFQTNSIAFRVARRMWWELGRAEACAYISNFRPGAA